MSSLYIFLAGVLWGSMGIFVKAMTALSFTTFETVFLRVLVSFLCMGIYILFKDRELFKVHIKDLPLFFGSGVVSFLFFTFCYFSAMQLCSISVAAVLLYTSPIFVMIMACIFFKEKITPKKAVAATLTVIGCALVSGIFSGDNKMTILGFAAGIGSGFGYALYSIFSKVQLKKYAVPTATFYTFLFAAVFSLPFLNSGIAIKLGSVDAVSWTASMGIVTCFGAYLLYNMGLKKTPASKAAVIVAVEPVVAAIIGVFVYKDPFDVPKLLGSLLVISSVVFLNFSDKK